MAIRRYARIIDVALLMLSIGYGVNAAADCSYNWELGGGFLGLNGTPRAMIVWDDGTGPALYVGGALSDAGNTAVQNIVKWDGSSWSPLGAGVDGYVYALMVHNGQLIVGGSFTTAGGQPAKGGTEINRAGSWKG